jgi:PX domain
MGQYCLEHTPFFVLPSLFLSAGILRTIIHWRDGQERSRYHSSRLILKILACGFCAILELLHIFELDPEQYYNGCEDIMRTSYFLLSSSAWILSGFLVYFTFKRRIRTHWIGQKGYWTISLLSNVTLLVLNVIKSDFIIPDTAISDYYLIQTVIYSLSIASNLFLTYYALFRPEDFIVSSQQYKKSLVVDIKQLENEGTRIFVSMVGYKIKEHNGSKSCYYEIIVSVNGITHKVSRTYAEFDSLHRAFFKFASVEMSQAVDIPELPNFLQQKLTSEEKTAALGEYLNTICSQNYFTVELLEFLNIQGDTKENILKNLSKSNYLKSTESVLQSDSVVLLYYQPKNLLKETLTETIPSYHLNWMINIQIPSWKQSESHIEYFIKSEIRVLSFESITISRFSEIFALHKLLKKFYIPVPEFPDKFIKQNLNTKAVEARKNKLEMYLGRIFNDPAFLSAYSLNFISCDIDINKILRLVPASTYHLLLPICWEEELNSDSTNYVIYHLKFTRNANGRAQEWEVSRRYKEFDALHKKLVERHNSQPLRDFLKDEPMPLPALPGKSISPLSTHEEIQARKKALEMYLTELIENPAVTCSYDFRIFIGEIE